MEIENHIFKESNYVKSPNFNNRPNSSDIRLIVIHCISLPPNNYGGDYVKDFFLNKLDYSADKYFDGIKELKVSCHLFIERTGELLQFVPFDKRAWHAGESAYKGEVNCNDYSIGIELEGNEIDPYTDEQYISLIKATRELINFYPGVNSQNIVGHCDIAPDRKTDPGKSFDWKRYLSNL